MKRPAYESPAVPIEFGRIDYETGTNDFVSVEPESKAQLLKQAKTKAEIDRVYQSFELKNVLEYWVKKYHVIPTDTIWFTLDKPAILRSGMHIPEEYRGATDEETMQNMPDKMVISLKGKSTIMKNELMMLEMLCYCNWERPLYMAITVSNDMHLNMNANFVLEGMAYRITPFNYKELGYVEDTRYDFYIDTEKMYKNLMNFKFGGLDNTDLYLDETIRRMCYSTRRLYAQLAFQLIKEGQPNKALQILDRINEAISPELLPHDYICYSTEMARCYQALGESQKAKDIMVPMAQEYLSMMRWYLSLDNRHLLLIAEDCNDAAAILYQSILPLLQDCIDEDTFKETMEVFNNMYQEFRNRIS